MEKARRAATWEAIQEASRLLEQRIRHAEEQLQAFEAKLCEGVTAYFLQHPTPDKDKTTPEHLWHGLKTWNSSKPLALYVEASLAGHDRLYLLRNILERFNM